MEFTWLPVSFHGRFQMGKIICHCIKSVTGILTRGENLHVTALLDTFTSAL